MMTDPIADMLTRIRNASMARHDRAEMPHSRLKEHVADVLKSEGYIDDVRVERGRRSRKTLTLVLRYGRDRQAGHRRRPRVSTPGPARLRAARPHRRACARAWGSRS